MSAALHASRSIIFEGKLDVDAFLKVPDVTRRLELLGRFKTDDQSELRETLISVATRDQDMKVAGAAVERLGQIAQTVPAERRSVVHFLDQLVRRGYRDTADSGELAASAFKIISKLVDENSTPIVPTYMPVGLDEELKVTKVRCKSNTWYNWNNPPGSHNGVYENVTVGREYYVRSGISNHGKDHTWIIDDRGRESLIKSNCFDAIAVKRE